MSVNTRNSIVTNGLVLYLDAASRQSYTSGSTVWNNTLSNSPYSCTILGPLQTSTLNGGSVLFSGSTSYGVTNYYPQPPSASASTYEITFKSNGAINNFTGLLGYSGYNSSGISLGLFPDYVVSQGYSGSTGFYDSFNINPNITNILTAVYESRTSTYYLNGIFVLRTTYAFDTQYSPTPVRVGNQTQGGWGNSNTYIFNVKFYNRALSQTEVSQNYNAVKTRFGLT
jgi:hypothetical protein